MNLERYTYLIKNDYLDYEFYSDGPKGRIRKAVRFSKVTDGHFVLYSLGFGDVDEASDIIRDDVVSDNGDRDKILATIAKTIIDFTSIHGNHYVFASGSTPARTRLYQMNITKFWSEIITDFEILGYVNDMWLPFEKDINYSAFLVKRK